MAGFLVVLLGEVVALPTVAETTRPVEVSAGPVESGRDTPNEARPALLNVAKLQSGAAHDGANSGEVGLRPEPDRRVELVRQSWSSIVRWLETHAPATAAALQGPVDETKLIEAQAETGRPWPAQLVAWLRMNDGGGRSLDSAVLPMGFLPLGADWIVKNWRMMVQISAEVYGPVEVASGEAQPAGSMTGPFLSSWLPFGDDTGGDLLFVDLRPGPKSGCVAGFEHDNGGFNRPAIWPDIAAMLEDVAVALQTGRWVHPNDPEFDRVPTVEDGRLRWEPGPASQRNLARYRDEQRRAEEWRQADD